MDPQRAAPPRSKRGEIAGGLRGDDLLESVRLARDRNGGGRIGGDLEEDARVWPALVELPRRMKESRTEPDRRRDLLAIPDPDANSLQRLFRFRRIAQVGGDREVVAALDRVQQLPQSCLVHPC